MSGMVGSDSPSPAAVGRRRHRERRACADATFILCLVGIAEAVMPRRLRAHIASTLAVQSVAIREDASLIWGFAEVSWSFQSEGTSHDALMESLARSIQRKHYTNFVYYKVRPPRPSRETYQHGFWFDLGRLAENDFNVFLRLTA